MLVQSLSCEAVVEEVIVSLNGASSVTWVH